MRKTILTMLGSALLAVSTVQIAAAAEHHRARKVVRVPAPVSEPFRNAYYNSNAYYGGTPIGQSPSGCATKAVRSRRPPVTEGRIERAGLSRRATGKFISMCRGKFIQRFASSIL
jgi:hypothetical protein